MAGVELALGTSTLGIATLALSGIDVRGQQGLSGEEGLDEFGQLHLEVSELLSGFGRCHGLTPVGGGQRRDG